MHGPARGLRPRRSATLLLALAFGASAVAGASPAAAETASHAPEAANPSCPATPTVAVRARSEGDVHAACDGAGRALSFLSRAGVAPPAEIDIHIVEQLPGELAGRAVGCYLPTSRRILLLSFEAFQAGGAWFRLPPDRALYTALAAHETAHAIVSCHTEPRRLPVAAQEYLAYVVMFATMDPALRVRLLAGFPGPGFESTLQINDVTHIVNPNQFAVDAWRHYLKRQNRDAWLQRMLAGDVVPEWTGDAP